MLFATVVETSRQIAETSKRTTKIGLLAALLRQLAPEEVEPVTAYLSGKMRQGRIGIGFSALRSATDPPAGQPSLTVLEVDRAFDAIAAEGSQRVQHLRALLANATEPEQHFLQRLVTGELRQGALGGLMLDALAKAANAPLAAVRQAAMVAGDVTLIARALLEFGPSALDQYTLKLFTPVQPMLAQTAEDPAEALTALGEAALEFKMDGARVQIHKSGSDIVVFSRSLKDVTSAVPEIVESVRSLPAQQLILDGEVLSLRADGRPQPFQVTARRFGRKLDLDRMRTEVPLSPFWFDLLYLNGANLLAESQTRRFHELSDLVPKESLMPHTVTSDVTSANEFLDRALASGHEGIMAKSPESIYAAGARGQSWLKIKHVHTLDLVILAAEWGSGRRRGWLSNLHLGAHDTENGSFAMLGKTFKGLTDEMLRWQTEELLKLELSRDQHVVYVEPRMVVEIAFNDIQVSPRYPSGLALRFARVKRYRTDKTAAQSDTFQTVRDLALRASQ